MAEEYDPVDLGEEEYEVEAIRSHRGKGNKREYLVKWKDYPEEENTWEPPENLEYVADLVQNYLDSLAESSASTVVHKKAPASKKKETKASTKSKKETKSTEKQRSDDSMYSLSSSDTSEEDANGDRDKSSYETENHTDLDDTPLFKDNKLNKSIVLGSDLRKAVRDKSRATQPSLSTRKRSKSVAQETLTVKRRRHQTFSATDDSATEEESVKSFRGRRKATKEPREKDEVSDKWSRESYTLEMDNVKRNLSIITDDNYNKDLENWDGHIKNIVTVFESDTYEGLYAALVEWKNGEFSLHAVTDLHHRCPQSLIKFYEKYITFQTSKPKVSLD